MSNESVTPAPSSTTALSTAHDRLGTGRLGTYSVIGAVAAALPLPFVPGTLATRVRGALVHDVCARYGLSLTPEARHVLSAPGLAEGPEGLLGAAVRFATIQVFSRLGPLTILPPIRSALLTFSIGHLLRRYLEQGRGGRSIRIDVDEARRVRRAIEAAIGRAITTSPRAETETSVAPEELRDQFTQLTDGAFTALASLPSWLVRRLEAAFDESIQSA
jgi:uncharacterized protein (DUF697 family)